MKLAEYLNNLLFILWNMVAFLCPIISYNNIIDVKSYTCCYFHHFNKHFLPILYNFKEFIKKINIKNKNNSTAEALVVVNPINKSNSSKLNRVSFSDAKINKASKSLNLSYIKRLKDALATQNLISNLKQHIFPIPHKLMVYRAFMFQLSLSYIKAYSDDLKKVMTVTQDKCAFLYPFVSKNHCSQYNL